MSCRDVRWIKLFTLFQLIRVIEGAGWGLLIDGTAFRREWKRYGIQMYWRGDEPARDRIFIDDDDLMLAAAQLAVRAVEGK